jgi:YD repeat-containing protein
MSLERLFYSIAIFLLPFNIFSQTNEIPADSIILKYRIKRIVVTNSQCDSSLRAINKGFRSDIYKFNRSGQLIKHKRKHVTYYYKYNELGQLISMQDKWKIFTNAWWQGSKYSCTTYKKDLNSNMTIIKEFNGKCLTCEEKERLMKRIISYCDNTGKDSLIIIAENNWYYASPDDTGRIIYSYQKINENTLQLQILNNFKRNYKTSKVKILKFNDKNNIIEMYDPSDKSLCPRFIFQYSNDLLKRKIHFNCLGLPNDFDNYKYYFR